MLSNMYMFEMFIQMDWGFTILSIISFPLSLLPSHTYTAGLYLTEVDEQIFGVPMKVAAIVSFSKDDEKNHSCMYKPKFCFRSHI